MRGDYSVVDIPRESMIARGRSRAGSLVSPAAVVTASNLQNVNALFTMTD